jgi:hypothetical protein
MSAEELRIRLVDQNELGQVDQVQSRLEYVLERASTCLEHGPKVLHRATSLGGNVASHEVTRAGIQGDLAARKQKLTGSDALRVRPDRRWRPVGGDYLLDIRPAHLVFERRGILAPEEAAINGHAAIERPGYGCSAGILAGAPRTGSDRVPGAPDAPTPWSPSR